MGVLVMGVTVLVGASGVRPAGAEWRPGPWERQPVNGMDLVATGPSVVKSADMYHLFYRNIFNGNLTVAVTGNPEQTPVRTVDLGVVTTAEPSAVTYVPPGGTVSELWVFYRGGDYRLWVKRQRAGVWLPPETGSFGQVVLESAPAAMYNRDRNEVEVYYRGPDDRLWVTAMNPHSSNAVFLAAGRIPDAVLTSAPTAVYVGWPADPRGVSVFYRGSNNRLWRIFRANADGTAGGFWGAPQDLGGDELTTAPRIGTGFGIYYLVYHGGPNWQLKQTEVRDGRIHRSMDLGVRVPFTPGTSDNEVFTAVWPPDGTGYAPPVWRVWQRPYWADPPQPPTASLTAEPNNGYINNGDTVTMKWSVTNCAGCSVELQAWTYDSPPKPRLNTVVSTSGSLPFKPQDSGLLFRLIAHANNGTSATVQKDVKLYYPPNNAGLLEFFLKLTNPNSFARPCFTYSQWARDEKDAIAHAQQTNPGYKAEIITIDRFANACQSGPTTPPSPGPAPTLAPTPTPSPTTAPGSAPVPAADVRTATGSWQPIGGSWTTGDAGHVQSAAATQWAEASSTLVEPGRGQAHRFSSVDVTVDARVTGVTANGGDHNWAGLMVHSGDRASLNAGYLIGLRRNGLLHIWRAGATIAERAVPDYTSSGSTRLRVVVRGTRIEVYAGADQQRPLLTATDSRFPDGSIGLITGGASAEFSNPTVTRLPAYTDGFAFDTGGWANTGGAWSYTDGEYRQGSVAPGWEQASATAVTPGTTTGPQVGDIDVGVDINITDVAAAGGAFNWAGLMVHGGDRASLDRGYLVGLRHNGLLHVWRGGQTIAETAVPGYLPTGWTRLRVVTRGNTIAVYAGADQHQSLITIIDTQFPQGSIGLITGGASARFDNVTIDQPAV